MQQTRNDSGIEKTLDLVNQELMSTQTIGLPDIKSEVINNAYEIAYKDKPFCPHYTIDADEIAAELKLNLESAAIIFEWDFHELVKVFTANKLKGHFKGVQLWAYMGNQQINEECNSFPVNWPIESIKGAFLMYQVDAEGKRLEGSNDIEILVRWHKSMTKTADYQLIEALFERLPATDFTQEELENRLAEIY
ncbi:hypothetical protein [Pseudoalteromonas pernae]|uniref:hypothetical protein n=1 Tax=Pseudoalteromonas pernae TaxID=3118054 RepID=UPI0032428061